jgi:hypothetical protein
MKLTDFLPGLLLDCPDAPQPQVLRHVREVVQEWCRHTEEWRQDLGPLDIVAGQAAYDLSFTAQGNAGMTATISKVLEVEYNGDGLKKLTSDDLAIRNRRWRSSTADEPSAFITERPSQLLFYPVPMTAVTGVAADFTTNPVTDAAGINRIYCVLVPDAMATDVDDVLLDWVAGIQDGVRVRLKRYLKRELRDQVFFQEFKDNHRRTKSECRSKTIGSQGTTTTAVARFPGSK